MSRQTLSLLCHPDAPCDFLSSVEVEVSATVRGLGLVYRLAGDPVRLRLPQPATPGPADGLWRHTCCEAFLAGAGEAYREFNFSPSGQWAVHDFDAYRRPAQDNAPPANLPILLERQAGGVALAVEIPSGLVPARTLALGLTAVIEAANGAISYWALAHAPGKPDFHRRETFALRLEQP
jgi:hypothetical protein